MLKRLFDIGVSGLALLVLWPVLLLVAVMVRMDSSGPALFRQVRIGMSGREFEILKLRTMTVSTESGNLVTADGDSRVTRVGHWLRKSKLDELPQLWNVFRGDMSLVGPRPEVPEYAFVYPDQEEVWSIRPGITDPASIRFRNESELLAEADDVDEYYRGVILPEKTRMYLEYVRGRSFFGDVGILFKTVLRVLKPSADKEQAQEG